MSHSDEMFRLVPADCVHIVGATLHRALYCPMHFERAAACGVDPRWQPFRLLRKLRIIHVLVVTLAAARVSGTAAAAAAAK